MPASFAVPGPVRGALDDDKERKWRKREGDRGGGGEERPWAEVTDEADADLWLVGGRIHGVAGRGGGWG